MMLFLNLKFNAIFMHIKLFSTILISYVSRLESIENRKILNNIVSAAPATAAR